MKTINAVLLFVSLVLAIYIGYSLFMKETQQLPSPAVLEIKKAGEFSFPVLPPYSQYLELVQNRNIFSPAVPSSTTTPTPTVDPTPEDISVFAQFKLMGTVVDQNPTAILLNSENNETIFLHIQNVLLEGVVSDIQDGRIVIMYQDRPVIITQDSTESPLQEVAP